jgi:hypothetical protein
MLQEYVNHNFIQISEDENLTKLKKATEEVIKKIGKDKNRILTYTLAAIDPEMPVENGTMQEVQEIIVKHWPTFVSNLKDSPVTYIRAVILETLESVAKDQNNASLIWNTSRNVIKYFSLGREKDLIVNFLSNLGNEIEKSASDNWALPSEANLEKFKLELQEITGVTIDKATLQKKLEDASGPSTKTTGAPNYEGPNPHWSNSAQHWSYEFAPRAAASIADAVNKALKNQASSLTANQTQIQEAVNKLISKTQTEILQKSRLLQMRTHLLWWKEACYSPSLKKSYRGLENGMLELLLAADYSSFVPHIYPESVDYFLLEFHKALGTNEKIKIADLLNSIKKHAPQLKQILPEPVIDSSRCSLFNFAKAIVWDKCNVSDSKNLMGISEETEITFGDFILWTFHDSQAFKLTQSK